MEQYYEQNVVNNDIDTRAKKTKTLVFVKTVFMIIGFFILVSSAIIINMIWVFILCSIPFFVLSFVFGKINKRNNTEYDYVIDDEKIRISEIYYRQNRKLKYNIKLRTIESIGAFGSEGYERAEKIAKKRILTLVNYDDEKGIIYILCNTEKGRVLFFLEPDRGCMIALRRALSTMNVFDKSISELEKYLREKEELIMAESLEKAYADNEYEEDTEEQDETDSDMEDNADNGNEQTDTINSEGDSK